MKPREVTVGRHTKVLCLDEPGAGGACHEYIVLDADGKDGDANVKRDFASVHFQNGAIKESGVNGCMNEDLLAIVLDRLYGFQSGEFKCRENSEAIIHLEEALHWLKHRTNERITRGVEGILVK